MSWSNLKSAVAAVIRNNDNQEITGNALQGVLNSIIDIVGENATFAGLANPGTNPGTPDGPVFYLASRQGTYPNFNNITIEKGLYVFTWNGSTWADSMVFAVDDEPTAGSENLVKSGGEYTAIENVEKKIDNKQTLFAENSGYTQIVISKLKAGKEYILRNLSNNYILGGAGGFNFFTENETTAVKTITGGSQGENDNIVKNGWISFYTNQDVVKINIRYADTNNYFSIEEKENRIDVLEGKCVEMKEEISENALETLQKLTYEISGGWAYISINLKAGLNYTLTKVGEAGYYDYLEAYDEDDVAVAVTGFSSLSNIGDSCTIRVAKDAVKLRAFTNSSVVVEIKNNLLDYTVNSIRGIQSEQAIQNTYIEKLNDLVIQLKSYSYSGWLGWNNYLFKGGHSYKITNITSDNANSKINYLTLRNADEITILYTGTVSNLSPGQSAIIIPNSDAVEFNIYFDGGAGSITIEDISTNVIKDIYALDDAVQIQEGYSSKDNIKHQVIVSKTGQEGHFSTIAAAYASITDSSYTNQYEVIVYPGKYNEVNLQVPPFTHTHGVFPNSVVVSSGGYDTTQPVFEQAHSSSKLSNLIIESHTGYCIHFDQDLSYQIIVNTNLFLNKVAIGQGATNWSIIGGGTFYFGTKYVWKNCIFKGTNLGNGGVDCHTNGNQINAETTLIFDSCKFINCSPNIGSVGGSGNYVCELSNCSFPVGVRGLGNWFSPIRNIEDPTLYRFEKNEWNIIGGGNKNLSMWQSISGKTIRLVADSPITISGTAANVIFGYNPTRNDVKTGRLNCTITSEYYIADEQAGYSGYSELRDVFQLWKRLGDCSSNNKELTVIVNNVSKTYTFTEDYLTLKTAQADIIAAMQAVLDNVTIEAIAQSGYGYFNVNTSDCLMIEVMSDDILKGEFVTLKGEKATSSTSIKDIAGVACEDKPHGEYVKVWTSAFRFDTDYADGEYGLDANGALDANAVTKIGFVKRHNFYLY